jgi:hypothetical protein
MLAMVAHIKLVQFHQSINAQPPMLVRLVVILTSLVVYGRLHYAPGHLHIIQITVLSVEVMHIPVIVRLAITIT